MRTGILRSINAEGKTTYWPNAEDQIPINELKEQFKEIKEATQDGNDEIVTLELWDSGSGVIKRAKFLTSDQLASVQAAKEADAKLAAGEKPEEPEETGNESNPGVTPPEEPEETDDAGKSKKRKPRK